jgi:hypothetical protein
MGKILRVALVFILLLSVIQYQPLRSATINVPGDYATIQLAVNNANPGDTIAVAPGTYTETVTIPAGSNLTLKGAGRDVVTWIAPADHTSRMHCIDCGLSGYSGTTRLDISGFTFSVEDNAISTSGIAIQINRASSGPLYLSIHDNTFIETTTIANETANSMLLCHNRFASRTSGAPVKIYNNLDYTNGGIAMSNTKAFDIYNNLFDGGSDALYIGYGCPTNTTIGDHHIYNNVFKNASNIYPGGPWPAIFFSYYGSGTGMTFLPSIIEYNTFKDNDVAIGYSMESNISYPADIIRGNTFCNSTEHGVRVFGTYSTTINARYNCWCHWTGPSGGVADPNTGTLAQGLGDAVSTNVLFDPWIPCGIPQTPYTPAVYNQQTCPLSKHNARTARDLLTDVEDLLEQAKIHDLNITEVEKLIEEARKLLEKAEKFCENSQNCIAGNTLAIEAQNLLEKAKEMLESMLS